MSFFELFVAAQAWASAAEAAVGLGILIALFRNKETVQADQIGAWEADPPPSYQRYTTTMNDLATAIANWRKVV